MTVTVPASDVANFAIQAEITALTTQIANSPLHAPFLAQTQQILQQQLVINLMNNAMSGQSGSSPSVQSHLSAAGLLSSGTINT